MGRLRADVIKEIVKKGAREKRPQGLSWVAKAATTQQRHLGGKGV